MHKSHQTYYRLNIFVNSIIEAIKFLFQHEVTDVLIERYSLEPIKNHCSAFALTTHVTITNHTGNPQPLIGASC